MFWKDRKKFRKKISAAFPACYRKDVTAVLRRLLSGGLAGRGGGWVWHLSDEVLYNGLRERDNREYQAFCRLNWDAFHKGYDRMLSYWAEYYRWYDPRTQKYCKTRYRDYVGWKLYAEVFGCKK